MSDNNEEELLFHDDLDDLELPNPNEEQEIISAEVKMPQGTVIQVETAASLVDPTAPRLMRMLLAPDRELTYTALMEPRCSLCRDELREQAEVLYIECGRLIAPVSRFLEAMGKPRAWSSIDNHFKKHVKFTDNDGFHLTTRIKFRKEELEEMSADELGFTIKNLNSLIMDANSYSPVQDIDKTMKVGRLTALLTDTKLRAIKLRSELAGDLAQAKSYVAARERKVFQFLTRLALRLKDEPQAEALYKETLEMIEQFRDEMME